VLEFNVVVMCTGINRAYKWITNVMIINIWYLLVS